MIGLIAVLSVVLIALVIVQIGKVTELADKIRGEEEAQEEINTWNGMISIVFMVVFLLGCIVSAIYYAPFMLGYGPHVAASEHGPGLDYLFNLTLFFTGIVFVITHIYLFWFSYKYRGRKGRVALYFPHDTKLEIIWTAIPAIVMTFLVVGGLDVWNDVMADVGENEEHIEIEATGQQFAWTMRYPGPDGALGTKYYKNITANNPVGMDFRDVKCLDDIVSSAAGEVIKLPIGKKVRVRITARDVLHNFDVPHFRIKMDAVPGLPTYFVFTPSITTEDYRERLGALKKDGTPLYPFWHEPYDPTEPDSKKRYEEFNYELACAELCGKGHYSMRRVIEIVSEEEWKDWMDGQKSFYMSSIRNTDEDPHKGKLLDIEIKERKSEFNTIVEKALNATEASDKIIRLDYVTFETGSAGLTDLSKYELNNLFDFLNNNKNVTVELSGHTDNTGDADANLALSNSRANEVYNFLLNKGIPIDRMTAVGYGQATPVVDNNTPEGREKNRRTEFKILTQ
ncbi:MAG: cytochrome c oxidase subunit 2 [Saprospiraceae bacterium]|jgi:cytochrome c oxidase subunit 2